MNRIRRWLLFAVVVPCLAALPMREAAAQPDRRDRVETETIADVEARAAALRSLPGADARVPGLEGTVALWAERPFLGIDNAYSGDGVRYLVVRLIIVNRGSEPLTIRRDRIVLKADQQSLNIGGGARHFRGMPLEVDRDILPQSALRTPEIISVEAGTASSFWCMFAGIEKAPVTPDLKIAVSLADGDEIAFDLSAQQASRLGLEETRLGPRNCLAVLTIHGQLNTINAGQLAARFEALFQQGKRRVIVTWSESALPSDELLLGWLLAGAAENREDPLYLTMPSLAPLPMIRLAQLPEENREAATWDEAREFVFHRIEDAVVDTLGDIFGNLPEQELLAELNSGHQLSRQALLRTAGGRLSSAALPLLLSLTRDEDPVKRRSAYPALARQRDPRSRPPLMAAALNDDPAESQAALQALLEGDRDCIQAVEALLGDSRLPLDKAILIDLLRTHYRPEWMPFVRSAVDDPEANVRVAALRALRDLGHRELIQCCVAALRDPKEDVASAAFEILVSSQDSRGRGASLDYALTKLKLGEFDETVLRLLEAARETRAAPIALQWLERWIEQEGGNRVRLIEFLGEVGSESEVRRLLEQWDRFNSEEQAAICELALLLPDDERLAQARRAVASEHFAVRYAGMELLKDPPSPESLAVLEELLDRATPDELELVADGIGELGTPEAIAVLRKYRLARQTSEDAERILAVVDRSIRIGMSQSPGWNSLESGQYHWRTRDFDDAVKNFSLAIELDPDLATAYSWRANAYLKRSDFDKARSDYRKAWDLDPFDGQAATGLGITLAIDGKWQEGIQIVEGAAERFPNDHIYVYNTACVYGRAIEFLQANAPEANRATIEELQAKALSTLGRAIKLGFNEVDLMKTDPDIAPLRDLKEFPKLLEQAAAGIEQ